MTLFLNFPKSTSPFFLRNLLGMLARIFAISLLEELLSQLVIVLYNQVPTEIVTPATTIAPVAAMTTLPMPGIKYMPAPIAAIRAEELLVSEINIA